VRCSTFKNILELKKIGIFIIALLFIGCSSDRNRNINKMKAQLNCNKTVYIVWDESNNLAGIEAVGTFKNDYATFTKGKRPNYKEIFIESLEALNKKQKTKFILKKNLVFPTDSIIQVTVKIDKIIWNKGYSKAAMDVYLIYKMRGNDIMLVGKGKAQSYVNARKNLLQSFEHGNLQFLLSVCKN